MTTEPDALDRHLPPNLRGDPEARAAVAESLRRGAPKPPDIATTIDRDLRALAGTKTTRFGPDLAKQMEDELREVRGATIVNTGR